jgi:hypothetical protein
MGDHFRAECVRELIRERQAEAPTPPPAGEPMPTKPSEPPARVRVTGETGSVAYYDVHLEDDCTILVPATRGSWASSNVSRDSYEYTHGGSLYRAAVDRAKAIQAAR